MSYGDCKGCDEPLRNGEGYCDACADRTTERARAHAKTIAEVLDATEAVIRDGEVDLDEVTTPEKAKEAQLELVAHIRDQLADVLEEEESHPTWPRSAKPMTRAAYEAMVAEDLAWLDKHPNTHEARHIRAIVTASIEGFYGPEGDLSMYLYEDEKPKLFTEDGSVIFSDIRDYVRAVITKSGAITMGAAIAGPKRKCGDSWLYMACVDRLVELGELRDVTPDGAVVGQDRIFMGPKS